MSQQENSLGQTQPLLSLKEYDKFAKIILLKRGCFKYSDLDLAEVSAKLMEADWRGKSRYWTLKTHFHKKRMENEKYNIVRYSTSSENWNNELFEHIEIEDLIDKKISTERNKTIVREYYFNNKTLREIAAELGISFKTVHKALHKSIEELCT